MAEGVDLQMNCRHVIHHDLCWNPSTLEQRTGRIDRIGGKVERSLKPIKVYMPFISETQDQKMFEVVMDRERWFKVVMGEKYKVDLKTTEKHAERLPLPEQLADELAFKIGLE
jgi:SNF2 family DNA or RNA helicase